jgi:TetR/AcrR family fatty acid metabolism transcriptional regulator
MVYIIPDRTVGQGVSRMCAKVVDKKEKKDLIIAAALREFSKKGFAKTTVNDIAAAAGIGKGTIYEYFSNKEEIIHETFTHFMGGFEANFQEVLVSDLNAVGKLKKMLESFAALPGSPARETMDLMFDFWAEGIKVSDSKGILMNHMTQFYQAYMEIFADVIIEGMGDGSFRKDINPHSAASMIVGCLDGLLVQWLLDKENYEFEKVLNTVSDILLKGLKKN